MCFSIFLTVYFCVKATKFTVITDSETDVKMLLKGADLAVADYEYTRTTPKNITVSTELDALTRAVEAYTSKLVQPLTDALASGSPQNTRKNVSKDDAEKIYKSLIM